MNFWHGFPRASATAHRCASSSPGTAGVRRRRARFEPLEQRTLLSLSPIGDWAAAADGLIFVPPGEKPVIQEDHDHQAGFNNTGQKWPQPGGAGESLTITYSYSNLLDGGLGGGLSADEIRAGVEEALGLWARYAPLQFVEMADSGPPPTTSAYSATGHPQLRFGHRFIDGSSGQNTLAVAFFPGSSGLSGDIHFDNGNNWNDEPRGGIDLIEVMTHELGHALGLGHEDDVTAVMGSFYRGVYNGPGTAFLYIDDINGIRDIYGQGAGSVRPLNERPQAVDDTFVVDEDGRLAASVLLNDVTANGDPLSVVQVTAATNGQVVVNADGTFQYRPAPDFFGDDEFTYLLRSGETDSRRARVTIHVRPTLDPPVALDDQFDVTRNIALVSGLPSETVIQPGATWRYLDDGSNQGTAWRQSDFDDSTWRSGAAELGHGEGDENSAVRFGSNPADKHITTYFRREFELTAANSVTNADVHLLRDDGAAVYINGVEVVRDNLAGGADFDTPASEAVVGSAESTFFTFNIDIVALPPGTLREGTNVIAAEVHLDGPTSPDLSFDLRLDVRRDNSRAVTVNDLDPDRTGLAAVLETAPAAGTLDLDPTGALRYEPGPGFTGTDTFVYRLRSATPATLVDAGSTWSFLDDGSDQPAQWREPGFDDAAWSRGAGQLGYGDDDEFTLVSFGPDPSAKHATTYFRKEFFVEAAVQVESLRAEILRDDAAAVYLNGVEIYRDDNLAGDAVFNTFATSQVADENVFVGFAVDPSLLVDGANLLAVEVHQRSQTSTDLSFDFSLRGTVTSLPATVTINVLPGLTGDTNGDGLVNIDDLNNVRNNFGQTGPAVLGDVNGDGRVDIDDLNDVRNNFGAPLAVPVAAAYDGAEEVVAQPPPIVAGRLRSFGASRFRVVARLADAQRLAHHWDMALIDVLDEALMRRGRDRR